MKHLILIPLLILLTCCKETIAPPVLRDGFYQVMKTAYGAIPADSLQTGQVIVSFDTVFSPGDYTKVAIDTNDYVPLELETAPEVLPQTGDKKLLSVTLSAEAAEKIKSFTASRVMKQVAIVLDGKAITMHKIRDTITGPNMQITRCDDNGCEYLYVKIKGRIK